MALICNKEDCKYRKSVFCGLDYPMLNEFAQCEVWYNWKGHMRQGPNYRPIEEPEAATEQGSPHSIKEATEIEDDNQSISERKKEKQREDD